MKLRDLTIALIITLLTVAGSMSVAQRFEQIDNQLKANDPKIETLLTWEDIEPLSQKINELENRIEELEAQVYRNAETISEIMKNSISRSGARSRIMRVTAYCLEYEDCKKHPDHPESAKRHRATWCRNGILWRQVRNSRSERNYIFPTSGIGRTAESLLWKTGDRL